MYWLFLTKHLKPEQDPILHSHHPGEDYEVLV